MTKIRRKAGGPPRGTPAPRRRARPPGLALLALALAGFAQAGCRSDGCNTCGLGGLGSRLTNGVQAMSSRVFNHKGVVDGGCCGGEGIGDGVIVDSGVPMAPGAMVTPGPLIPAPVESPPTDLRPLDENRTNSSTPNTSSSTPSRTQSRSAPTGTSRSAYEASRGPSGARGRGDVARAMHSPSSGGSSSGSPDLLDNIPPVDLPAEVTRKATTPARSAQPVAAPVPAAAPSSVPEAAPAASVPAAAPAAENVSAAEGPIATLPTIEAPTGRGPAPGILRCSSVEPNLMGGSLPTAEGLDWLGQRGYKTFLDLRARNEVDPSFVDSVSDRGMVYIALPILANRLDASRLARFDDLVSQTDPRPLYFCDADGSRAGLAWYIHRVAVDHYDPQAAAHEAGELGLGEAQLKDATAYLAASGLAPASAGPAPAAPPEPGPIPAPIPDTAPRPVAPSPRAAALESSTVTARAGVEAAPSKPKAGDALPPQAAGPRNEAYRDPTAWKSIAALVLTGIGVPLAYWSRSAVSLSRRTPRASLTAGPRRSLVAPPESGA